MVLDVRERGVRAVSAGKKKRLYRAEVIVEVYFVADDDASAAYSDAHHYLAEEMRANPREADVIAGRW